MLALVWLGAATVAMYERPWAARSDFWAHAATVRELALRPFVPRHPLVDTAEPSVQLTPWTLAVALAARWTGSDPISALAAAGVVNALTLALALCWWVSELSDQRQAPFWTLLFTLFLWGPQTPWKYSGFLHIGNLDSLPYPSAFALALSLAAMASYHRFLVTGAKRWAPLVILAGPFTLLIHPVAAIFLFVGLATLTAGAPRSRWARSIVLLVIAGPAAILGVSLWPYFPFWELVRSGGGAFHLANRPIYVGVVMRTLPVWAAAGILLSRLRTNLRDPLVWLATGLAAVFVFGGLSHRFSYGRVLSPLVLVLHLVMADWLAANWPRLKAYCKASLGRRALGIAAAALAVYLCYPPIQVAVTSQALLGRWPGPMATSPDQQPLYERYRLLADRIGEGDVVLAEPRTGWPVPAFGGKIISPTHPEAFVGDTEERRQSVQRFFSAARSESERREILAAHQVSWLLVNRELQPEGVLIAEEFGKLVASNQQLQLYRITGETP